MKWKCFTYDVKVLIENFYFLQLIWMNTKIRKARNEIKGEFIKRNNRRSLTLAKYQ